MKRNGRSKLLLALVVFLLVQVVVFTSGGYPVAAQSGGGYDLTWNVVAGGGTTLSVGGAYTLGGTIGQPDAGTSTGGTYMLNGGFWNDALLFGQQLRLYLPLIGR